MSNPVKQIVDSAGNVLSIVDYEARNIIAPAYNTNKTYTVGEYCIYNNKMYKCTTSVDTPGSFNPNSWLETTNSDELSGLNSSIIDLNNNKQDKYIWIRGNGAIYNSRLASGAGLAYWTYTFPNSSMKIVIVYCVFKAATAISENFAIATGFPAGSVGSPVALTGLKTVDNTNVPFYINASGSLICMGSIAINGWAQCGGIYVSGGVL